MKLIRHDDIICKMGLLEPHAWRQRGFGRGVKARGDMRLYPGEMKGCGVGEAGDSE